MEGQEFIETLRQTFRDAGIPASVFEPLLSQLETLFAQDIISQDDIDAITSSLAKLLAEASVPVDVSQGVLNELQQIFDDVNVQVEDTSEIIIRVEDTSEREIPFAGVPETEDVPFEGVPEGTLIAVEDTADREIAVEDTSDRTIQVEFVVPTTEQPETPQAPQTEPPQTEQAQATTTERNPSGGPRPSPPAGTFGFGDTARYDGGVANQYSAGELEILARIGEEDASLPISQEHLEVLLGEGICDCTRTYRSCTCY